MVGGGHVHVERAVRDLVVHTVITFRWTLYTYTLQLQAELSTIWSQVPTVQMYSYLPGRGVHFTVNSYSSLVCSSDQQSPLDTFDSYRFSFGSSSSSDSHQIGIPFPFLLRLWNQEKFSVACLHRPISLNQCC